MPGPLSAPPTPILVGAGSTQVMGTNVKRTCLIVNSPPTNRITIAFGTPAVLDAGITANPGQLPLRLCIEEYGEMIQRDIFAVSAVGPQTVAFAEMFDT